MFSIQYPVARKIKKWTNELVSEGGSLTENEIVNHATSFFQSLFHNEKRANLKILNRGESVLESRGTS